METESFANTAMAAQFVAEQKDSTLAAVASKETAVLYGLRVLEKNINSSRSNTTRFGVFTREDPITNNEHFILTYTVKHEAGALAKTISTIGRYGFNMCAMRSRPMKELMWQYYFYVEAEGNVDTPDGKVMLDELKEFCDKVKTLGTFTH
jgi:prephenate dehydratase